MLLVNDPGSWEAIYPPLEHAPWNGWTPTDLVFPFFLFIVGITTTLSAKGSDPRRIVKRGLLIILCGLLLNAFPFFWWGKMAGIGDPTFWQRVLWRAQHLRFAGVLQRIGIAYMCGALIARRTTLRQQLIIIAAILLGYWFVMTLIPVPGTGGIGYFELDQPDKTPAAYTDRLILGANHIWASSKTWDPEGPLSTIPAIATVLLGIVAGRWLTDRERPLIERVAGLYGGGSVVLMAGVLWSWVFPINKNLWTSSYVLFTAGFAAIVLATCVWLIDVNGWRGWGRVFVPFGVNPLVAFIGSGLMARTIDSLIKLDDGNGGRMSLHSATFQWWFEPYFPEKFASLLWGLCFVAFWFVILEVLYKKKVVIKL